MVFRNRELKALALSLAIISLTATTLFTMRFGPQAGLLAFLFTAALVLIFTLYTRARYRALADLAASIDRELHEPRSMQFERMNEGELSILANELEKLVNRLNLTAEQLEHERSALSDALADISHQIKTPMTSLSIMTEVVRKRLTDVQEPLAPAQALDLAHRLRTVETLQERVQDLVAALLKLARIDAGTIALASRTVTTTELVRQAFSPLAIPFDIAGVTFETNLDPKASFTGDIAWSAEALENILKNCLEHTPSGGRVCVESSEDALACRIRITDSGPGIAPEDLPHIFERFYRGKQDRKRTDDVNPAGVGIGLALSKNLIVAQGGKLIAKNAIDGSGHPCGAQFEITFFKTVV